MQCVMVLEPEDHKLSGRISPRARTAAENEGLRKLVVNRLRPAKKAVLRVALKPPHNESVYCEPCGRWVKMLEDDVDLEWQCPHCSRVYIAEAIVYSEADPA